MNIPLLQKIDRWAGVPLCLLLTLARSVFGRSLPPGPVAAARSILFIKLAEQGSTVLAGAAIARAVEMAGRENVFFVTFEENRFILDLLQLIPEENVITICRNSAPRLASSTWRAMRRMRRLKLDAAVDMEFFSRGSAIVACLSGARVRVGFHAFFGAGPYRGNLMTHRLLYNPHLHASAMFQVLVEALTCDPARLPTLHFAPPAAGHVLHPFAPRPEETEAVRAMLPGGPLILLNPNASDLLPLRRWPGGRYVELARRLFTSSRCSGRKRRRSLRRAPRGMRRFGWAWAAARVSTPITTGNHPAGTMFACNKSQWNRFLGKYAEYTPSAGAPPDSYRPTRLTCPTCHFPGGSASLNSSVFSSRVARFFSLTTSSPSGSRSSLKV